MEGSQVDGSLGLILGLLDDLFGGRARIHLFDRTTRVLRPAGVDEPPITAPGPLHRALDTTGVVVEHVGTSVPPAWSGPYRAWMPRGECHLVASRIEGGGEVVGVLSVLRNENTSVPAAEDRALVGALAARLGRSAAVTLARAIGSGLEPGIGEPRVAAHADVDIDLRSAPSSGETDPTDESSGFDEADIAIEPDAAEVPSEAAKHLPESAAAALNLDADRLELVLTTTDAVIDDAAEKTLVAVLEALASLLSEMSPRSGIRIEFARSGPDWVASIRPKLLAEGWPARPAISDSVVAVATDAGADIDVVANPELGWLIEVRTPAGTPARRRVDPSGAVIGAPAANAPMGGSRSERTAATFREAGLSDRPAQREPAGSGDEARNDIDLMAASLGDTARMLMIAISGDGRIVFCNDELAARLGIAVADLLGRPFRSAKGSDAAWDEFGRLFARVMDEGLAQQTLSWPHPEDSGQRIRWTVSRSASRTSDEDARPMYLCFGVDA